MTVKRAFFLTTCLIFILFSCRKDEINISKTVHVEEPNVIDGYNTPTEFIKGTVYGQILDEQEKPISEVNILLDDYQTQTNKEGFFQLKDIQMNKLGTFLKAEKSGYINGSKVFYPTEGSLNRIEISLIEKDNSKSFSSFSGGEVSVNEEVNLSFTPNSFAYEDGEIYSGDVFVFAKFFDPSIIGFSNQVPGDLSGLQPSLTNKEVSLFSFGILLIELYDAQFQKLSLIEENFVSISLPISSSLAGIAPEEVSLWFFNENIGKWVEEVTAIRIENTYKAELKHLSFWNCAIPDESINLKINIKELDGSPLKNTELQISLINESNLFKQYTNEDGVISLNVPQNKSVLVKAYDRCGGQILNENIGPFFNDETVELKSFDQEISTTSINGFLVCETNAKAEAIAVVKKDNQTTYHYVGNTFEILLKDCDKTNDFYNVSFVSLENQFETGEILVQSGQASNVGIVDVCKEETEEYINFRVEGEESIFAFYDPFSYTIDFLSPKYTHLEAWNPELNLRIEINLQGMRAGSFAADSPQNGLFFNNHVYFEDQGIGFDGFMEIAQVETYGEVGEFITGYFSGRVSHPISQNNYSYKNISGSFKVKREANQLDGSYTEFISQNYRFIEPNLKGVLSNGVFETISDPLTNLDGISIKFYGEGIGSYSDPNGVGNLNGITHQMEEINWALVDNNIREFIITDFGEVGEMVKGYWSDDVERTNLQNNERYSALGAFAILRTK